MLEKAKQMLRDEFVKQPALAIFFTTEPWRVPLIAPLVETGYLAPAREMATAAGSMTVYDITDLARAELR